MRIGLISDVHWMVAPPTVAGGWHGTADFACALDRLGLALGHFGQREVDLVVVAGDLAHNGDADSIEAVLTACAAATAPVLVVAGNHDVAADADALVHAHSRANVADVALASPHGIVHDGIRLAGVHVGAAEGWFRARLRELPDLRAWGDALVVLVSHYPLLSLASLISDAGLPYPGDLLDRRACAALLAGRAAPTIVIGGHVHARATVSDGAVLQFTAGALVEAPYECAVLDVEADDAGVVAVARESLPLRDGADGLEPVFSPPREQWLWDGRQWSSTNGGSYADPGEEHDEAQHREDPDHAHRQPSAS